MDELNWIQLDSFLNVVRCIRDSIAGHGCFTIFSSQSGQSGNNLRNNLYFDFYAKI